MTMTTRQRLVIMLKERGFNYREIAERLEGRPTPENVRQIASRGLKKLSQIHGEKAS